MFILFLLLFSLSSLFSLSFFIFSSRLYFPLYLLFMSVLPVPSLSTACFRQFSYFYRLFLVFWFFLCFLFPSLLSRVYISLFRVWSWPFFLPNFLASTLRDIPFLSLLTCSVSFLPSHFSVSFLSLPLFFLFLSQFQSSSLSFIPVYISSPQRCVIFPFLSSFLCEFNYSDFWTWPAKLSLCLSLTFQNQ